MIRLRYRSRCPACNRILWVEVTDVSDTYKRTKDYDAKSLCKCENTIIVRGVLTVKEKHKKAIIEGDEDEVCI